MADWKARAHTAGLWKPATWKDRLRASGIWKATTRKQGFRRAGIWKATTWKQGFRRAGIWKAGIPFLVVLSVAAAGIGWQTCVFEGCPDVSGLTSWEPEQTTVVLDRDGARITELYRTRRSLIAIDSLPPWVPAAFVSMEDQRFFRHRGIDWVRFGGALRSNVQAGGVREGASTITMQLARNLFPEHLPPRDRTLRRKAKEMRVAQLLEQELGKDHILELYLNQIYFGESAYGVDAAAREYFGRRATQLSLAEAALLAGLPRSPVRYNPRADSGAAVRERNEVLSRMVATGAVEPEAAAAAATAEVALAEPSGGTPAQWFVEQVRRQLEAELGDVLYTGGLRVHTTLDPATQTVLEEELERQAVAIEAGKLGRYRSGSDPLQYAGVVLDPHTGEVLAMVGGRDFAESKFNRAVQAARQPGSAFKPVVYAAALDAGHSPIETISDEAVTITTREGDAWTPRDGTERADVVTMDRALALSRNAATVRLANDVGMGRVARLAERLGIARDVPAYASLPLGTVETTPLDLTAAFAVFANGGVRPQPRLVTRVADRHGNTVWSSEHSAVPVIQPATAFLTTTMLRGVIDGGTGWRVRQAGFRGPAGGKTGTTQNGADLWFAGFTPQRVATIWFGFDRPRPVVAGGSGGRIAAPVWGRVMKRAHPEETVAWPAPSGVEQVRVDGLGTVLPSGCEGVGPVRTTWVRSGPFSREGMCPEPVRPHITTITERQARRFIRVGRRGTGGN